MTGNFERERERERERDRYSERETDRQRENYEFSAYLRISGLFQNGCCQHKLCFFAMKNDLRNLT